MEFIGKRDKYKEKVIKKMNVLVPKPVCTFAIQTPNYLFHNLNEIRLPTSLWGMHYDPQLTFLAFLRLSRAEINRIIIDRGIVLNFNSDWTTFKIYINGDLIDIPKLNFEIDTIDKINNFLYMFENLKLCENYRSNDHPKCSKYIDGNCDNLCMFCSTYNLNDTPLVEYDEKLTSSDHNPCCDMCGKQFSTKEHLKEHMRLHTGIKPYECDICHKTNSHRSTHHKHMLKHSDPKPFLCNVCGKRFDGKSRLETHLLTHNPLKKLKCNVCSKRFSNAYNLKIHQATHTGFKQHECKICGKIYSTPSNLSFHHKSAHSNDKRHSCKICGMAFVHPKNLKIHLQKHTGEKPFKCKECGKHFSRKMHLVVHQKTHTGEKPYPCLICGKCFTTSGNLKKHDKVHSIS